MNQEFDLATRNQYTKVKANMTFHVDGNELPTMAVLGGAVEEAIITIQKAVAESYKTVPTRL
jgi:hypothetical protein